MSKTQVTSIWYQSHKPLDNVEPSLPMLNTYLAKMMLHMSGRVKSPTLPRYAWIVGFISLEQTFSLEVPFENE
jgi:hypothetical protein